MTEEAPPFKPSHLAVELEFGDALTLGSLKQFVRLLEDLGVADATVILHVDDAGVPTGFFAALQERAAIRLRDFPEVPTGD